MTAYCFAQIKLESFTMCHSEIILVNSARHLLHERSWKLYLILILTQEALLKLRKYEAFQISYNIDNESNLLVRNMGSHEENGMFVCPCIGMSYLL